LKEESRNWIQRGVLHSDPLNGRGAMPRALVFVFGHEAEHNCAIRADRKSLSIRIGRGTSCELAVPSTVPNHRTVSREHVRLFRHAGNFMIEHIGSRSLTIAGGRIVSLPLRIDLPAELLLGQVPLTIREEVLEASDFEVLESRWAGLPEEDALPTASWSIPSELRDAALSEAIRSARWSGALLNVASLLCEADHPDKAEIRLRRALEIHLGAARVSLAIAMKTRQVAAALREWDLPESLCAQVMKTFESLRPERPFTRRLMERAHIAVWAVPGPAAEPGTVSCLIARLDDASGATEETECTALVIHALHMAGNIVSRLRETEMNRASQMHSIRHSPSRETLRAAELAGLHGMSAAFMEMLWSIEVAANRYLSLPGDDRLKVIFLLGERGVGKTSAATLIHHLSDRRDERFLKFNAAGVTESLADGILFGVAANVATQVRERAGLFEEAARGTLFIDEIGRSSLETQGRILTVLDTGEYHRVGEVRDRITRANLILATNLNPEALVREGRMLPDLWDRCSACVVEIPPLRDRFEDMETIVRGILRQLRSERHGVDVDGITDELLSLLLSHAWPGNIRELANVLAAAVTRAPADTRLLGSEHLLRRHWEVLESLSPSPQVGDTPLTLEKYEAMNRREYFVRMFRECGGVMQRVIEKSGAARQTIYDCRDSLREWLTDAPPHEIQRLKAMAGEYWGQMFDPR
jgi:DNA-binding NtrC family response regulator